MFELFGTFWCVHLIAFFALFLCVSIVCIARAAAARIAGWSLKCSAHTHTLTESCTHSHWTDGRNQTYFLTKYDGICWRFVEDLYTLRNNFPDNKDVKRTFLHYLALSFEPSKYTLGSVVCLTVKKYMLMLNEDASTSFIWTSCWHESTGWYLIIWCSWNRSWNLLIGFGVHRRQSSTIPLAVTSSSWQRDPCTFGAL